MIPEVSEQEWPTEAEDLLSAEQIIDSYLEANGEDDLGLVEVELTEQGQSFSIKTPDWMIELSEHFDERYGDEYGSVVTSKVITKYLLKSVIIH